MGRDLTDKVVVITGAGSGIGAATARACAESGMHVVLNGRREETLAQVAAAVRARGRNAELVCGDVTERGMTARMLDAAERRFGRFDVVYANAGYGFKTPTHELDEAGLRRIFEVNFFAGVELLAEAARRLIADGRHGHLLMCSSCVARFTLPAFGAYSATKAAQHHICRSMRMDLRRHGIHVSSVHPVSTRTEFFERAAEASAGVANASELGGPAWMFQRPERVARAIVSCLRRPRPEVWTSFSVRVAAGIMTVFPRAMDLLRRVG